jgi:hypothetical protein
VVPYKQQEDMPGNPAQERNSTWYAWWSHEASESGNDVYVYTVGDGELRAHGISDSPEFPTIGWEDKKLVGTVPDGNLNPRVIKGSRNLGMKRVGGPLT